MTDELGQRSSATVHIGAVATDESGRVIMADSNIANIIGPQLRVGQSPWPWFDDRHQALAGWFGNWLDTDDTFQDQWNVPLSGTITVTNGSPTVTGSGTTFQTAFCAGGASPTDGNSFVIWYPVGDGKYGRRDYNISRCDSQTQVTLDKAYDTTSGTASGLHYANWRTFGYWCGGSDNRNYYDNVTAYYSLYYRTGLTRYLTWARTLADRWWTMPDVDEGRDRWGSNGNHELNPRQKAMTGLVLRALDGRSDMWPGLTTWLDIYAAGIGNQTAYIYDLRELSYQVAFVALGAKFHPDSAKRASYINALERAISLTWAPVQTAQGGFWNPTYGYKSANDGSTLTATHGSADVALAGGTWQSDWFWHIAGVTPNAFLICAHSFNGIGECESVAYIATYVDSTHATLDRPYEGTTGSMHGWQMANIVGEGTQPFMMGVAATAWNWAYSALVAASSEYAGNARRFVLDIASWITNYGFRSSTKGLYYGRFFPNCEPIRDGNPWCSSESAADSRYLSSEVVNAFTAAYVLSGDEAYRSRADTLFGAMWGGPSSAGPGADGIYNSEYADGGWTYSVKKSKNFGFAFGFGLGAGWPAARLGVIPASPGTRTMIGFDPTGVSGATQVRISLMKPIGETDETVCEASPCTVMVDQRQGDPLMRSEYLAADGHVLSSGEWTLVAVQ